LWSRLINGYEQSRLCKWCWNIILWVECTSVNAVVKLHHCKVHLILINLRSKYCPNDVSGTWIVEQNSSASMKGFVYCLHLILLTFYLIVILNFTCSISCTANYLHGFWNSYLWVMYYYCVVNTDNWQNCTVPVDWSFNGAVFNHTVYKQNQLLYVNVIWDDLIVNLFLNLEQLNWLFNHLNAMVFLIWIHPDWLWDHSV